MRDKYVTMRLRESCKPMLRLAIEEYRRHHPELGNESVTYSTIVYKVIEFYLRDNHALHAQLKRVLQ